eukprot:ANDGO_05820.mRNA.1 hypothetical protein
MDIEIDQLPSAFAIVRVIQQKPITTYAYPMLSLEDQAQLENLVLAHISTTMTTTTSTNSSSSSAGFATATGDDAMESGQSAEDHVFRGKCSTEGGGERFFVGRKMAVSSNDPKAAQQQQQFVFAYSTEQNDQKLDAVIKYLKSVYSESPVDMVEGFLAIYTKRKIPV